MTRSLARVGVVNALVPAAVVATSPHLYTTPLWVALLVVGFAGHVGALWHGAQLVRRSPAHLTPAQARALTGRVTRWLLAADIVLYAGAISGLAHLALRAL